MHGVNLYVNIKGRGVLADVHAQQKRKCIFSYQKYAQLLVTSQGINMSHVQGAYI